MRDLRELPLFSWGEERRHRPEPRRRRRLNVLAVAAAAAVSAAVTATLLWPPGPLLLWNATDSSPLGLYRVSSPRGVGVGDMVVAWPPEWARDLGAERHYLPRNVPLVKRVAAAGGDRVCAIGEAIFVNARLAALRSERDPSGRLMPWWTGCERLGGGDLFLLTPGVPQAFDGRYFGISRRHQIVGRARLTWRG